MDQDKPRAPRFRGYIPEGQPAPPGLPGSAKPVGFIPEVEQQPTECPYCGKDFADRPNPRASYNGHVVNCPERPAAVTGPANEVVVEAVAPGLPVDDEREVVAFLPDGGADEIPVSAEGAGEQEKTSEASEVVVEADAEVGELEAPEEASEDDFVPVVFEGDEQEGGE